MPTETQMRFIITTFPYGTAVADWCLTYQGAKDCINKDLPPGVYEIRSIFVVTNADSDTNGQNLSPHGE